MVVPGRTRNAFVEQSAREFESLRLRQVKSKTNFFRFTFFKTSRDSHSFSVLVFYTRAFATARLRISPTPPNKTLNELMFVFYLSKQESICFAYRLLHNLIRTFISCQQMLASSLDNIFTLFI